MAARLQQIEEALTRYLAKAGLQPGDKLPPERELSGVLGCSRETLRRALAALEIRGELWRHVGQGTFLGVRPPGHPVREAILVQGASPMQLMQARLTIEPGDSTFEIMNMMLSKKAAANRKSWLQEKGDLAEV